MANCNKQLNNTAQQYGVGEYDPDLPNANAVMAAICCVSSQFIVHPSADLAMLVADLAHKLTAPQYAESKLVTEVAKRLVNQWDEIVREQQANLMDATPLSESLH
jgi:hypothetical protein